MSQLRGIHFAANHRGRAVRVVLALLVGMLTLVPQAHAADTSFVGPIPRQFAPSSSMDVPTDAGRSVPVVAAQVPTAITTFTGTANAQDIRSELVGEETDPQDARIYHTATRLQDGRVLIVGGVGPGGLLRSAELYDPATGKYATTGNMKDARRSHTATLLKDGKVLIAGGYGTALLSGAELYDPATGMFTPTGSMTTYRYNHTATLLNDGKVLIVGGNQETSTDFAGAEVYDPTSGTFSASGEMQQRRGSHTATLLLNGRVLIAGGVSKEGFIAVAIDTAEIYDPATDTFTSTAGVMQKPRSVHSATRLQDGRVLLTGGYDGGSSFLSAEIYDPATDFFSSTGSMSARHYYHKTTLLQDGRVLVTGGLDANGIDTAEIYDPASGTFSLTDSMTAGRYGHTSTLLLDGTVLIVGGSDNSTTLQSAERYDPARGTFTSTRKALNSARWYHTATLLQDGRVLVAGGSSQTSGADRVARAEVYDPTTGAFTLTDSMQEPRIYHTATLLPNGNVVLLGGYAIGNGWPLASTADTYDPGTGTFTSTSGLDVPRINHTATLLSDGTVLIVGGLGRSKYGVSPLFSAEVYDPATGTSTIVGSMTTPRAGHAASLLDDGTVLITGGVGGSGYAASSAERYDPTTRTFTATASMPTQQNTHTSLLMPNGKVLIISSDLSRGANVYDPATDTWTYRESQNGPYIYGPSATLLEDGQVLLTGGRGNGILATAVVYNPATATFTTLDTRLKQVRVNHTATLLSDGSVLLVGGTYYQNGDIIHDSAERVWVETLNTFSGSLTLPSGWVTTATPTITFTGSTTGTALTDGSVNGGPWVAATPNEPATTTLPGINDGRDFRVVLRLRDADNRVVTVVKGRVDIDTTLPTSKMTTLAQTSDATFSLRWSGSDATSGIGGYDLDVRDGDDGAWTPVLTSTTALSTTFTGEQGHTYFFRVRARDVAGNVEAWPTTFDATTEVDTVAPTGTFTINRGALATTSRVVNLALAFADTQSPLADFRVAQDDEFEPWRSFQRTSTFSLNGDDGLKIVAVQVRDRVGNVSAPVTRTIRLDRVAGTDSEMTINDGAKWTNTLSVTLRIGAPAGVTEMRVSNDGGFVGAPWQAFDTRPSWLLESIRPDDNSLIVYVRVRDANGDSLGIVSDNIFYDPLPPTGTVTVTNVGAANIAVALSARDQANLSGVKDMRVSTDPQFAGANWKPYATRATVPGTATRVYAQFRDVAGNVSAVVSAGEGADGEFRVFLPVVRR